MEIVNVFLPVFGLIAFGYFLRWRKFVKDEWASVLNKFVYYISLPALITVGFWQIDWQNEELLRNVGFNVVVLAVFALLLFLSLVKVKLDAKKKSALLLTALVGNTVYMGFPILGSVFGAGSTSEIISTGTVQLAWGIIISVLLIELLVVKAGTLKNYGLHLLKNPVLISMAIGCVLSFVDLPALERPVRQTLLMAGATASPLGLLALGSFLHGKFYKHQMQLTTLAVILKLATLPLFFVIADFLIHKAPTPVEVSVILAGMPTAVTAFVVAEQYKLDKTFVANAIVLSTVASLATLVALVMVMV